MRSAYGSAIIRRHAGRVWRRSTRSFHGVGHVASDERHSHQLQQCLRTCNPCAGCVANKHRLGITSTKWGAAGAACGGSSRRSASLCRAYLRDAWGKTGTWAATGARSRVSTQLTAACMAIVPGQSASATPAQRRQGHPADSDAILKCDWSLIDEHSVHGDQVIIMGKARGPPTDANDRMTGRFCVLRQEL